MHHQFALKLSMLLIFVIGLTIDLKPNNTTTIEDRFKFKLILDESKKVQLVDINGAVWHSLSYNCNDGGCKKYVSDIGVSPIKSSDEVTFLIEIHKIDRDIEMTCHDGCAWESLSIQNISSSDQPRIDYYGVKP